MLNLLVSLLEALRGEKEGRDQRGGVTYGWWAE